MAEKYKTCPHLNTFSSMCLLLGRALTQSGAVFEPAVQCPIANEGVSDCRRVSTSIIIPERTLGTTRALPNDLLGGGSKRRDPHEDDRRLS